jgi:hypothetical protein
LAEELAASRADFTTDDIVMMIVSWPSTHAYSLNIRARASRFRSRSDAVLSEKPTQLPVVLVAFRLAESPSDDAVNDLTKYLGTCDFPISVLAALPVDSTLLLIELPELLLDFLHLDQCYVT